MRDLDENVVRVRLQRIAECVEAIRSIRPDSVEDYVDDAETTRRYAIERQLTVAVQAAIDVALHIVLARGLGAPETYRDAMLKLKQDDVLPADLAETMADAVGVRNVLIHLYLEIEPERVFAAVADAEDLLRFNAEVTAWMKARADA